MAVSFLITLAIFSIMASIVALYVLIIASFEKKESKEDSIPEFVKKDTRIIFGNKADDKLIDQQPPKNTRITSLIWTVLIGQSVGVYFLLVFIDELQIKTTLLRMNGAILLLASILCSILTILNGWLKKKMVIAFRLGFQGYSFILASILFMNMGWNLKGLLLLGNVIPNTIIIIYILTVIIALGLMLWDGVYRKHQRVDYDFNKYFRLVVLVGMVIGLGMYIGIHVILRS